MGHRMKKLGDVKGSLAERDNETERTTCIPLFVFYNNEPVDSPNRTL